MAKPPCPSEPGRRQHEVVWAVWVVRGSRCRNRREQRHICGGALSKQQEPSILDFWAPISLASFGDGAPWINRWMNWTRSWTEPPPLSESSPGLHTHAHARTPIHTRPLPSRCCCCCCARAVGTGWRGTRPGRTARPTSCQHPHPGHPTSHTPACAARKISDFPGRRWSAPVFPPRSRQGSGFQGQSLPEKGPRQRGA